MKTPATITKSDAEGGAFADHGEMQHFRGNANPAVGLSEQQKKPAT